VKDTESIGQLKFEAESLEVAKFVKDGISGMSGITEILRLYHQNGSISVTGLIVNETGEIALRAWIGDDS